MELILLHVAGFLVGGVLGWFANSIFMSGRNDNSVKLAEHQTQIETLKTELTEAKRGRAALSSQQNDGERTKAEVGKARDAVLEAQREIADLKSQLAESEKTRLALNGATQTEINELKTQLNTLTKTRAVQEEVAKLKAELAEADKLYAAQEKIEQLRAKLAIKGERKKIRRIIKPKPRKK